MTVLNRYLLFVNVVGKGIQLMGDMRLGAASDSARVDLHSQNFADFYAAFSKTKLPFAP
jgi:DNA-binding winged helix-turn-helix (wHTH) protein